MAEPVRESAVPKSTMRWADESEVQDTPDFLPSSPLRRPGDGGPDDGFNLDGGEDDGAAFGDVGPYCVFVGGLKAGVGEDELRKFFSDHNCEVSNVRMPLDQSSRPKGFGYVEFESLEDAKTALRCNGVQWRSRTLKVDIAERRPDGSGSRRDRDRDRERARGRDGWYASDRGGYGGGWERRDRGGKGGKGERDQQPESLAKGKGKGGKGREEEHAGGKGSKGSQGKDRGSGKGGKDGKDREAQEEPPKVAERPKLMLKPRTKPLEEVGGYDPGKAGESSKPDPFAGARASARPDPFGGAKPRSEDPAPAESAPEKGEPAASDGASEVPAAAGTVDGNGEDGNGEATRASEADGLDDDGEFSNSWSTAKKGKTRSKQGKNEEASAGASAASAWERPREDRPGARRPAWGKSASTESAGTNEGEESPAAREEPAAAAEPAPEPARPARTVRVQNQRVESQKRPQVASRNRFADLDD